MKDVAVTGLRGRDAREGRGNGGSRHEMEESTAAQPQHVSLHEFVPVELRSIRGHAAYVTAPQLRAGD